jgi:hypothetical protein
VLNFESSQEQEFQVMLVEVQEQEFQSMLVGVVVWE